MSNAQHTPGPWSLGPSTKTLIRIMSDSPILPRVADAVNGTSESEANARLIAAAPELLKILERIESIEGEIRINLNPGVHDDHDELIADVRAAIAKAKGGNYA